MVIENVKEYFKQYGMEELEKYSGFTEWVDVCKGWE
jgi:hypothetical protein